MANFPLSVYNPSAVSNGQTIDAARDNGQDAELTAIEAGYLQGTAPLNSSNSTVANFSVTGGSTFTTRPVMPPPDACRVFATSTHALASSQISTLTFGGQDFLTNSSLQSTTTNPDRLTPQTTGVYLVQAQLQLPIASAILYRQLQIQDSTGGALGSDYQVSTAIVTLHASGLKRVDVVGTYFRCIYSAGGLSTMSVSTGNDATWFAMQKL